MYFTRKPIEYWSYLPPFLEEECLDKNKGSFTENRNTTWTLTSFANYCYTDLPHYTNFIQFRLVHYQGDQPSALSLRVRKKIEQNVEF